jgi:hypothetical protein
MQEDTFAQLKVWQLGAIAVIFFLSPNITLQAMLNLMTTSLFISFGSFLFLTLSSRGHRPLDLEAVPFADVQSPNWMSKPAPK